MHAILVIIVFILLISFGVFNLRYLDYSAAHLVDKLPYIENSLYEHDQNRINESLTELKSSWKKYELYWHSVIDHKDIEKVEQSFAKLESNINQGKYSDALTELDNLRFHLQHIPQTESICLENIL